MVFDFRKLAVGVALIGLSLGVAFGAGVAVGRGDPKTVESGLSAQQLQTLLGTDVLQTAVADAGADNEDGSPDTAPPAPGGAGGPGGAAPGGAGGLGGAAGLLGQSPSGVITAINPGSITLETRGGSLTIELGPATTLHLLSQAEVGSLEEGQTVIISGSANEDGAFVATSISEVPEALGFLTGAGGAPGGGRGGAP